ncbi:MAG TPA: zinc-dependent alcohol dehydrogenase family protein [Chthoniobacterales bacterium]|nr:zinc-dependent alcohol dehydrogenase family protein [Chthoniobacterales bacterium]
MRAMVLTQQKPASESPLVLREVDEPRPAADEVRVKVSVCAVCRTDLHIVEGDLALHRTPVIPGHQVVGRIDRVGEGVSRFRVGQRIGIAWLRHVDGTCSFCRRGRENLCPNSRYTGYDADGGYAEYAVAPEDFAYELPDGFDDEHVSPLLCAGLIGYRALERAAVPEKGRLLLVGFGSSARIVLQLALHRGHEIHVVTRSENHIRQAKELGAAWAGSDFRDLPAKVDSAILFAPSGKLVPPTMEALARGGICSIAGIHLSDVPELNYARHLYQERELRSVTSNTRDDARALFAEASAARLRLQTTPYSLQDANRALTDMKQSNVDGTPVLIIDED